jgi:hypothetical protein
MVDVERADEVAGFDQEALGYGAMGYRGGYQRLVLWCVPNGEENKWNMNT